jgi:hypothetical protein
MIHLKYANSRMTWEYAEYVEKAGYVLEFVVWLWFGVQ